MKRRGRGGGGDRRWVCEREGKIGGVCVGGEGGGSERQRDLRSLA